ncbi:MAG: flagellar assembly protein FliW [Polyangiaceae bacterium]|nr:flagellar assembly protein FliW [Polyangiaceae bacterium]
MNIISKRFGKVSFEEDAVINFPHGIIGFPEAKKYILLGQGESGVVGWLQSVDAPEIALPVASAHAFPAPYPDVPLTDAMLAAGMEAPGENVAVLAVIIATPAQEPTVNLLAPIVIDADTRQGAQVILQGSRFSTRELLVFRAELKPAAPVSHDSAPRLRSAADA